MELWSDLISLRLFFFFVREKRVNFKSKKPHVLLAFLKYDHLEC